LIGAQEVERARIARNDHPRGHAHFFLESNRFCTWMQTRLNGGMPAAPELQAILNRESDAIRVAIGASCTESNVA
jgi:hypothetical protein